MKKKLGFLALLLICATVLCSLVAVHVGAAPEVDATMTEVAGGATVSAGDVISISSAEELTLLAKYVYEGKLTEGVTFVQTKTIDLPDASIATQSTMREIGTAANPFKGTYDGQGFAITNVKFSQLDSASVTGVKTNLVTDRAPFAYLDGATVENLTIETKGYAAVRTRIGGIAANAKNSTVRNCSVVTDTEKMANANLSANILAVAAGEGYVGGIVGSADNSVIDGCSVYITVSGAAKVGGIVGYATNGTVIRNCRSTATVNAQNPTAANKANAIYYGGIVGMLADAAEGVSASKVENCYAGGKVAAYNIGGGIAGYVGAGSSVENCFADATVSTHTSFGLTGVKGGIAGQNNGSVSYVYCAHPAGRLAKAAIIGTDVDGAAVTSTGTVTGAYMYKVEETTDAEENTVYNFVLGNVITSVKDVPCAEVNGSCNWEANNENTCQFCNSDGLMESTTVHEFEAFGSDASITVGETANITALEDALNAWITEFRADTADAYVVWVAVGDTILNCSHTDFVYKAYEGKAPTCTETGIGDKHCALCDKLIEENVTIPAIGHRWNPKGATCVEAQKCLNCGVDNPDMPATGIHQRPAGVPACKEGELCTVCSAVLEPVAGHTRQEDAKDCESTTCTECEAELGPVVGHTPVASYTCKDTTCSVCEAVIAATTAHEIAEDAFACKENACIHCGDNVPASIEHTRPEDSKTCQTVNCTVCGEEDAPRTNHAAGMAATCTTDQICRNCGAVLQAALGHRYAGEQTCVKGIACIVCGQEKEGFGALGFDACVPNKPAPTCTERVNCVNCGRTMKKALGHTPSEAPTCGKGQACTVCNAMIASATGGHTFDWASATTVREATADVPGIISVKCTVCGRTFDHSVSKNVNNEDGYGSISGDNITAGTVLDIAIKNVKDYAENALTQNYTFLQIVDIDMKFSDVVIQPEGTVRVTLALNKTAKDVDAANLKLFHLKDDGTSEEVAIIAVENGNIVFETTHFSVYAVAVTNEVAGEMAGGDAAEPAGMSWIVIVLIVVGSVVGVVAIVAIVAVVLLAVLLKTRKKKGGATADVADSEGDAEVPAAEPAPVAVEALAKDALIEEAPAEEAPVEEAPTEEAPVEEAPAEEAPVEEAPVEEAPAEEALAEEAPVAEEAKDEE